VFFIQNLTKTGGGSKISGNDQGGAAQIVQSAPNCGINWEKTPGSTVKKIGFLSNLWLNFPAVYGRIDLYQYGFSAPILVFLTLANKGEPDYAPYHCSGRQGRRG
jgi:hypothetical protein